MTEKGGAIRVVQPDSTLVAAPALTWNVETESERGLLGITIDVQFANNHFVYVMWSDGNTNRIRTISTPAGGGQYEAIYTDEIGTTIAPPPPPPPPNTAPSIQAIADNTIAQGAIAGPFNFTIYDTESAASSLTISVTSSNATLLPVSQNRYRRDFE